jgi:uncharacterized C2H2 Zn-finger protein
MRLIRESTRPPGEPIVTYAEGETDLVCGECGAVLVRGIDREARMGDMLLRCPACHALNDPSRPR